MNYLYRIFPLLCLVSLSLPHISRAAAPASFEQALTAWRRDRVARLTSDTGWLTLAGLFWLEEGENTVGSDAHANVVLPGSAPSQLGIMIRHGKSVRFIAKSAGVLIDNKEVTEKELVSDADPTQPPTVIQYRTLSFFVIVRGEKVGVRLRDSESPVLKNFAGINYFSADPAWRIEARYEEYHPPKKFAVPNVLGTSDEESSPGFVVFNKDGKSFRLDALLEEGDNQLFFIFADTTNRHETYGAGRFLYSDMPKNGKVVLDFNRAYNPPCAFTPYATCPLPPQYNHLELAVTAGEKRYH